LYDLLGDKKHLLNKIKSEFKIKTSGQAYQPLVSKTR
jgi:hypothetical protein